MVDGLHPLKEVGNPLCWAEARSQFLRRIDKCQPEWPRHQGSVDALIPLLGYVARGAHCWEKSDCRQRESKLVPILGSCPGKVLKNVNMDPPFPPALGKEL